MIGTNLGTLCASLVQQRADLDAQFIERERLADHLHSGVKPAMMHDGVARIAGREKHLQSRPPPHRFVGKLAAIHATRHDHISEQQIDPVVFERLKRGRSVTRRQHPVAQLAEDFGRITAERFVILDDQDGLGANRVRGTLLAVLAFRDVLVTGVAGKVDFDGRAFADFAVDADVTAGESPAEITAEIK